MSDRCCGNCHYNCEGFCYCRDVWSSIGVNPKSIYSIIASVSESSVLSDNIQTQLNLIFSTKNIKKFVNDKEELSLGRVQQILKDVLKFGIDDLEKSIAMTYQNIYIEDYLDEEPLL